MGTTIPTNTRWNAVETYVEDNNADPEKSDAYATWHDFKDDSGDIIGRLAADAAHNHVGLYTRRYPLGDSRGKRVKRFNVGGGTANTEMRLMSPKDTRFWISAKQTPILDLQSQSTGQRTCMFIDTEEESLSVTDLAHDRSLLSIGLEEPSMNIHEQPLHGLREIENPTPEKMSVQEWAWDATDSRWLYKDGAEEVHWFRPCGTL